MLGKILPRIEVGLVDWHFYVNVGERRFGFTVGPLFLSLDKDNDIAVQVISPPKGFNPASDIDFHWCSRGGE